LEKDEKKLPEKLKFSPFVSILCMNLKLETMVKSDLYIHGNDAQLKAIKTMVLGLAEGIGCTTDDESELNIPIGMVMDVLVGDPMHLGLLVGLNTEDPECVVVRVELPDASALVTLRDALLECFDDIDIEVDEDVADVPWPFE
jgi:hypothetical protein